MVKGVYILGTDTDVGKTFISGLILKKIILDGIKGTYFKPVLSGGILKEGEIIPGDCEYVCKVSGIEPHYTKMVSYTLKNAYSPHLASTIEGINISFDKIKNDYEIAKENNEFIVCEGSGGIICPISSGKEKIMLEDIVKDFKLPIILVSKSGLGAINHAVLTIKYLESKGLDVRGIVFNKFNEDDEIHLDNIKFIESYCNIKNIITVPFLNNIELLNLDEIGRFIYEL